jgi:succinate dehydrogenase/fumarate reductase flavoprotein subunit
MMVNRLDIYHFLNMRRSVKSLLHLATLSARFALDRVKYSRGTRLVIGNAMIAALLKASLDRGVEFRLNVETKSFLTDSNGSVVGILALNRDGSILRVQSRGGVILGTGGLSRRSNVVQERPGTREDHISMAAPHADGSMISLAEHRLRARVGGSLQDNFYWFPMSEMKDNKGASTVFPHIVTDRAKPGIIAVTDSGRRFVNEANSYHRFVQAMIAQQIQGASRFYLIADHKALDAYGLGMVRPWPGLHRKFISAGYLMKADSIAGLAALLEIDPATLEQTIEDFNGDAVEGVDPKFHRGESSYNRAMGDMNAKHPSLAPLKTPPFYAVRIVTGDAGSAKGLMTDRNARVLDTSGKVISGLYAVGTDMNSPMGGTYPGPGIVLGTGITFGYIAARSIIERFATR